MSFYNIIPFISFMFFGFVLPGRILYLQKKGIRVSNGLREQNKSMQFLYPIFLLLLLLWIFELAKPAFQISFSVLPQILTKKLYQFNILHIAGTVVIAISLLLMSLTLLHFKNSLRFGLDETNPGELISHGVFAISRNPFFVSLDLYFIGVAFVIPNLFFIGFVVLALVSIHFFILKEEKFMLKVYGEEYENYRKKVGRYF